MHRKNNIKLLLIYIIISIFEFLAITVGLSRLTSNELLVQIFIFIITTTTSLFFIIHSLNKSKETYEEIIKILDGFNTKKEKNPIVAVKNFCTNVFEKSKISNKLINENSKQSFDQISVIKNSVYHISSITAKIKLLLDEIIGINANIEQSSVAVQDIKNIAENFSNKVILQVSAVTETTASVEEMNVSIKNISGIASKNKNKAKELLTLTGLAAEQMEQTNKNIKQIDNKIETVNEIIHVINSISQQTNLLAMNAAIEAAHAGDAGKGFAVVASEIRKLAESTASNSKLISTNLQDIIFHVKDINEKGQESYENFIKVKSESNIMVNGLDEIDHATSESMLASSEILKAMTSLNSVSVEMNEESNHILNALNEIDLAIKNLSSKSKRSDTHIKEIFSANKDITKVFHDLTSINIQKGFIDSKITSTVNLYDDYLEKPSNIALILQHLLWVIKVRGAIDGVFNVDISNVKDHTKCDLGKFLDSDLSKDWKTHPSFSAFLNEHKNIHNLIHDIIHNIDNRTTTETESKFEELTKISEKIISYLAEFEKH